ncbi:MAG: cation:proton antiporter [Deltaproteobacteria bacterium]|nr:cation:proton antiporter [Deltaproteobacteria bacterium]
MYSASYQDKSILKWFSVVCGLILLSIVPSVVFASTDGSGGASGAATNIPLIFLWIAVILMLAKASSLIERVGQPAVLGELLVGVAAGSLYLVGLDFFEPVKTSEIIHFLAELGVVILLFQIGMESSVKSMMKVGIPAFIVACIGVILPFVAIYFLAPYIIGGLSANAYLFLGATLTATSVGITARVLKDLGRSDTTESRIIIGAAVIDDVLGLIILAVVSAMVMQGSVSAGDVLIIVFKAAVFLVGGLLIGAWLAPRFGRGFSKINTGVGMKFALIISFGLVFSYIASLVGLAPIVGAFAAGLVLTPVYFEQFSNPPFVDDLHEMMKKEKLSSSVTKKIDSLIETHSHRHMVEFVEHLGHFFIPIFFILTGIQVKIAALWDFKVLVMAGIITIIAVVTKVAAGVAAGKGVKKLTVGIGMIPRGEVGLIFANMGKGLGVMDDTVFSAMVVVIMLTTLVTPPLLAMALKRS